MRGQLTVVLAAALLSASLGARAVQPDEILPDPRLEARARAISGELRCLVCQNQSIDDSDAPLARDLRLIVRERLTAGDQDQQVRDFIVRRYGEFVLLKPVLAWHTALLWLCPVLLLGAAAAFLLRLCRQSRPGAAEPNLLTSEEEARLNGLIGAPPPRR